LKKRKNYIYKNSNSQRRNNKFASRTNYSTNKEEYSIVPCKFNVTLGAAKQPYDAKQHLITFHVFHFQ
jgi:hypothetical protein